MALSLPCALTLRVDDHLAEVWLTQEDLDANPPASKPLPTVLEVAAAGMLGRLPEELVAEAIVRRSGTWLDMGSAGPQAVWLSNAEVAGAKTLGASLLMVARYKRDNGARALAEKLSRREVWIE